MEVESGLVAVVQEAAQVEQVRGAAEGPSGMRAEEEWCAGSSVVMRKSSATVGHGV